jgi:Cof subfamily protein (haloacid dehalogenase superfamily)
METKRRMIITDLDGSLLRNDKTISEYTRNVLEKCHQNDILIIFATARPKRVTLSYIDIIKPDGVIFHNGAIVTTNGEIISQYGISPLKTKEIIKNIENEYPEATISAEINDVMYTNFIPPDNSAYMKIDYNVLPNSDADKIIIGTISVEKIKKIEKYLPQDMYLEINDGKYGYIMNKKASKWQGIIELSKYFGIEPKNTIAFGDDTNDFTMIKNCGKGICMKNGLEEIKTIADDMCDDNENDGIAKWIEENILEKGQNCI